MSITYCKYFVKKKTIFFSEIVPYDLIRDILNISTSSWSLLIDLLLEMGGVYKSFKKV